MTRLLMTRLMAGLLVVLAVVVRLRWPTGVALIATGIALLSTSALHEGVERIVQTVVAGRRVQTGVAVGTLAVAVQRAGELLVRAPGVTSVGLTVRLKVAGLVRLIL